MIRDVKPVGKVRRKSQSRSQNWMHPNRPGWRVGGRAITVDIVRYVKIGGFEWG